MGNHFLKDSKALYPYFYEQGDCFKYLYLYWSVRVFLLTSVFPDFFGNVLQALKSVYEEKENKKSKERVG